MICPAYAGDNNKLWSNSKRKFVTKVGLFENDMMESLKKFYLI